MAEAKAVESKQGSASMGAMELVGEIGFSLYFAWMFLCFYWLFATFLPNETAAFRDTVQLLVFVGIVVGYLAMHLLARRPSFMPFNRANVITYALCSLLMPVLALLLGYGVAIPAPVLCVINFMAGMASAALVTCWLDTLGRLGAVNYLRFTSLSLLAGCLLFLLVTLMPLTFQPILSMAYALASCYLLKFASARAQGNQTAPESSKVKEEWSFSWEIEPSLLAFGTVFGLTFVHLFNNGSTAVLIGLSFTLLGAAVMAALASCGKEVGITALQRVLLCVTVMACLAVPFATDIVQVICSGFVVASWAAFMSVNYALLVRKSTSGNFDTPIFRQIPLRLVFVAAGFMAGWAIATLVTCLAGPHSDMFMVVRLCMAFALVVVLMLFFPVSKHHDGSPAEEAEQQPIVASNLSDKELFEKRCAAVAKMYQLSPRETDILDFLARGRNASYIQNKLTISPHTVKSHIYSIYRKLDIHSQQKLMDFVEDYPLDQDSLGQDD